METEQGRRQWLASALALTKQAKYVASAHELDLLEKYVLGVLTLEQVLKLLEAQTLEVGQLQREANQD